MTISSEPLILGPGEGRSFPVDRPTITVKTDAGTSPVALFESEPPPGVVTAPPHLHRDYTESFYVLAGEIEFRIGDRTVLCASGAFVHVPPGVVHGFQNPGPGHAKLLILVYPAAGLGIVEDSLTLTSDTSRPPDPREIRAMFAKYHSELIQP
jgi:mannose-6-phosphate isomerase-like protein (cupin superfamily)